MLPLLLLIGCGGNAGHWLDAPTWDPYATIATDNGLYALLPHAGGLAHITRSGSALVDIGEGRVNRVEVSPDLGTAVLFIDRYQCDDDDDYIERVQDCWDGLQVSSEFALVRDGAVTSTFPIETQFNALEYANDGAFAVAYMDFSLPVTLDGVVNLTSVFVIDLVTGEAVAVPVGFAADTVLFVYDDAGASTGAVVLSQSEVAVLDLTTEVPEVDVTFPLTLDPDQTITPVGVSLTPDGQYALISTAGRNDLYALDLINHSVNILTLTDDPSAMVVEPSEDRTVLVYGSSAVVDVIEHDFFDIDSRALEEPMTDIASGEGFVVLYSTKSTGHDVYRLDLSTEELVEYRLQNPAASLHISPDDSFAIALTTAETTAGGGDITSQYDASPGMEIIDLLGDDTVPYLLEGVGLGVAFTETSAGVQTLILQEGAEYLYRLDAAGSVTELRLSAPPRTIGGLPDGTFFITHDAALGLVSFFDPTGDELVEVGGFAVNGLADPIEFISEEAL
jgi:hypothetical protein